MKQRLLSIMGFILLLTSFYCASAADVYVCQTAGCDYNTTNVSAAFDNNNNTDNNIIFNGSGTYTINKSTSYNITDSGADGAIIITGTNLVINCNSSTIDGEDDAGYGIYMNSNANNVTLKNCFVNNYSTNIYLSSVSNITINDSESSSCNSHTAFLTGVKGADFNNVNLSSASSIGLYLTNVNNSAFTNIRITSAGSEGLYISDSNNNNFTSHTITSSGTSGVQFESSSSSNILTSNTINNSGTYGIRINDSTGNSFASNVINNSGTAGLNLNVNDVTDCSQNFSGTGNLIDGNLVRFYIGLSDQSISSAGAYVGIVNSDNISFSSLAVTGNYERGLFICNVSNSSISSINVTGGPTTGIDIYESDENNLTSNRVNSTGGNGIYAYGSEMNNLVSNTITSSTLNNIMLNQSNNNTLSGYNNLSSSSQSGLYIYMSNFTTVRDSHMISNTEDGIEMLSSHNTTIINNSLRLNTLKGVRMTLSSGSLIDDNTFNSNIKGAFYVNASNSTRIFNNSITNIDANSNALGIHALNSDSITIYNNTLTNLELEGFRIISCDSGNISNNHLYDVKMVNISSSNHNHFISNLVNNSAADSLVLSSSDNNTFNHNTLRYSAADGASLSTSHNNSFTNNTIINNTADGIEMTSSEDNGLYNNTINYNSDNGVEMINSSNNNLTYNYIKFNLIGISLEDDLSGSTDSCQDNNISYNDLMNNTNYEMENKQTGVAVTAENNYWGGTWAYYIDSTIYDDDEGGVGAVDFCPMLNSTFTTGASTSCTYPSVALHKSLSTIAGQDFTTNGTATDSYFSSCIYSIINASDSSVVWANGSFDSQGKNFSQDYDGIYLPVGSWNLTANCSDSFGNSYTNTSTMTSVSAILPTVIGSASKSGTIGGSDITFSFNIVTKQHPYVKFYMNLTSGANTYNTNYAKVGNSTTNQVNISGSSDYSGAQNFNLTAISSSSLPSYVISAPGIYQANLTLYITPYSGLSAGSYTGSYGWGLFDS